MKINKEKLEEWRDGAEGFFRWIADMKPRIKHSDSKYRPVELTDWQRRELAPIFERTPDGSLKHKRTCLTWPRRHSKTVMNVLVALHRFFTSQNQIIKVLANSERQATSTAFRLCRDIITHTPHLKDQLRGQDIQALKLTHPQLGNEIEAIPANKNAITGETVNLILVTELWAAPDPEVLQLASGCTGACADGQIIADSTIDPIGGPIHKMQGMIREGLASIYVSLIEYADLAEALEQSPPWVDREWLKAQAATMFPEVFDSQHLNRRSDSLNRVFKDKDIEAAMAGYAAPVEPARLQEFFQGRKFIVGCGLDKARALRAFSTDKTVWTVVAKVANPEDGEAEYWVLNQHTFGKFTRDKEIKRIIQADAKRFKPVCIALENYEAEELYFWGLDNKLPVELVNPSLKNQYPVFAGLHSIVAEGRLHYSSGMKELESEMRTFMYEQKGKDISFGHANGYHDDHVYSLGWAVWALRDQELASYELKSIYCNSRSQHARFCYLRGGDLILSCCETCEAHKKVQAMHGQYRAHKVESEMTLPEFYKGKVKFAGYAVTKCL